MRIVLVFVFGCSFGVNTQDAIAVMKKCHDTCGARGVEQVEISPDRIECECRYATGALLDP